MYPKLPTTDQQQPNILDPARLEAFRKNWEYYKMWNPQVFKKLNIVVFLGIYYHYNSLTLLSYMITLKHILGTRKFASNKPGEV